MPGYGVPIHQPCSNLNGHVVEVVVGGEVVGNVGQDHAVLEHREDGVHPWLAETVVPPVEVEGGGDAGEVGHQELPLEGQRLVVHRRAWSHTVEPGCNDGVWRTELKSILTSADSKTFR